jgi:hypothetical protein
MTEVHIPRSILVRVLNRRRRLVLLKRMNQPTHVIIQERDLLDKALDDFVAWAEEQAPDLFYTESSHQLPPDL